MNVVKKLSQQVRQRLRKLDPWTIRPPDWKWEHEEIPYLPNEEKYFQMAWGGIPYINLSSIIQNTAAYIFPYGNRLDYDDRPKPFFTGCEASVNEALSRNLLRSASRREVYDTSGDIIGLLRDGAKAAFTYGEAFYHVMWEQESGDEQWIVSHLSDLPNLPNRVRKERGDVVRCFDVTRTSIPDGEITETLTLREEDLFRLTWAYSPGTKPGRSPLDSVLKELMQVVAFNRRTMAYAYAINAKHDNRIFVARSRRGKFKDEQTKLRVAEVAIRAKLGVQPDAPLSEYYGVLSYVQFLKMCNLARREFLEAFSSQVLRTVAQKNGWDCRPRLEYEAGVPDEELDSLFLQYTTGTISEMQFFSVVSPRMS